MKNVTLTKKMRGLLIIFSLVIAPFVQAQDQTQEQAQIQADQQDIQSYIQSEHDLIRAEDHAAINKFMLSPSVQHFFDTSYGYAIFPSVGYGAIGLGYGYGTGRVYVDGENMGNTSLGQLSIGAQLGGQAYSEIVFFQDEEAYHQFTSGKFRFGAQVSAVAIVVGASAQTGGTGNSASAGNTHARAGYINGMAVFVHSKGGFLLEAALSGQTYTFSPVVHHRNAS